MSGKEIEILLIEDNIDDATLAILSFKRNNLTNKIIHLKNGYEALQFIFSGVEYRGEKYSEYSKVILLDLKMPKVDGIEVLTKIKSDPATKSIPVIILTSSAEDPDIKKCYELGANSYIVKPVDFENFSRQIAELGLYWTVLNKIV